MARVALTLFALLGSASATELTKDNWDDAVAGKTVFVKFLAPWCGHCKKLKPDWDKLMSAFKDSKTLMVADVDCITGGKELCEELGVRGYPTIKYGDPDDLQDYEGGRSYSALKKHADSLGPSCSPTNIDLCDDAKKKLIEEYKAMPEADLNKLVEEKEGEIKKLEKEFEEFVEGLQKQYQEASDSKDKNVKAVKDDGLGLLKSVRAYLKKAKEEL